MSRSYQWWNLSNRIHLSPVLRIWSKNGILIRTIYRTTLLTIALMLFHKCLNFIRKLAFLMRKISDLMMHLNGFGLRLYDICCKIFLQDKLISFFFHSQLLINSLNHIFCCRKYNQEANSLFLFEFTFLINFKIQFQQYFFRSIKDHSKPI